MLLAVKHGLHGLKNWVDDGYYNRLCSWSTSGKSLLLLLPTLVPLLSLDSWVVSRPLAVPLRWEWWLIYTIRMNNSGLSPSLFSLLSEVVLSVLLSVPLLPPTSTGDGFAGPSSSLAVSFKSSTSLSSPNLELPSSLTEKPSVDVKLASITSMALTN
nr:hypothetical protein I308_03768 [Cryptococcus tetragattii IND107]